LARHGDLVDVIALRAPGRNLTHDLKGVNLFAMIEDRSSAETGRWTNFWRLLRLLCHSFVLVGRRHRLIKYDLVHVHQLPDIFVFAALYPKWTGSKVILDIHDIEAEDCRGYFKSRLHSGYMGVREIVRRLCTAFSDHVIFSNQLRKERRVARSMSDERCSTGVEPETHYLSLVDSLCAERFESADSVERDPDVPRGPRVLQRPTAVQIIDENPVLHPEKDVH
jgi:hypothetical protein